MPNPRYKIALVANTAWSIYNFRRGLCRALIQRGIQVYAIAPMDDYAHKLIADGLKYIPLHMDRYGTHAKSDMKTLVQLFQIYKEYQFDKVFHYTIKANIYGSIAAGAAGVPSISIITGLGKTFQFGKWTQRIVNSVYKKALVCAEEVWFLNTSDRERFIEEGFVEEYKTKLLPSEGVDTDHFQSTKIDHRSRQYIRLLYSGRLLRDKGILQYVEAAKQLKKDYPDIRFDVVGFVHPENPMSVSLQELMDWQNQGWITYLGAHHDIRPFINAADCVVYPSFYNEGISRILLEAASMSRPIISTDQPGCREVVEHAHTGLLVKPQCVTSLVLAIEYFIDMAEQEREEMGAAARELVVSRFDESRVINIYLEKLGVKSPQPNPIK